MSDGMLAPLNAKEEKHRDTVFYPILCTLVAGLGAFMFGYTLGFTSPTLPSLIQDDVFHYTCNTTTQKYTSDEADLFGSIVNVGCIVGALAGGYLTDAVGRKFSIILAGIPWVIGWSLITFSKNFALVLVARILTGIAVGVCSLAVPVYIAEIAPSRLRGMLGCSNQLSICIGIMAVYLIGAVLPHEIDTCTQKKVYLPDWHLVTYVGIGVSAGLMILVGLILPRSPNWLVSKGKEEAALSVIKRLRGSLYDSEKELESIVASQRNAGHERVSWSDMTATGRAPWIIGIGMMFCQQLSGINAIIFFSGSIFSSAGLTNPDQCALIVAGTQVVFTFVGAALVDRYGRKALLLLAASLQCLFSLSMGIFYYINKDVGVSGTNSYSWLAIVSLVGYIVAFSCGMGAIPWLLMSEIFPSKIRGKAASVATVVNWTLSFIVTELFNTMNTYFHEYGTFWFFSAVCFLSVIFVQTQVVETKGKSLEELERYFLSKARK